jgi:hypothetical protein
VVGSWMICKRQRLGLYSCMDDVSKVMFSGWVMDDVSKAKARTL